MDNTAIASILSLDSRELTRLCSISRGNFLFWSFRQILMTRWYDLPVSYREYLLNTLRYYAGEAPVCSKSIGHGIIHGYVTLPIPHLQHLIETYRLDNPFTQGVNFE
jgi:hypothetical protein